MKGLLRNIILFAAACAVLAPADACAQDAAAEAAVANAIAAGEHARALELLGAMGNAVANDTFLLRLKAFCLVETGRYDEALAAADRILELDPSDTYAGFYRAQALAGLDRVESAKRQLQRVVAAAPESAAAELIQEELPDLPVLAAEVIVGENVVAVPAAKRVTGWIAAGMGWDDNPSRIGIATPATGNGGDSWYGEFSLSFDFLLASREADASQVDANLEGYLYRSVYLQSPFDAEDYTVGELGLRLATVTATGEIPLELSLTPGIRYTRVGSVPFYYSPMVGADATWQIGPGSVFWISYDWESNHYDSPTGMPGFFDRDGHTHRAQVGASSWLLDDRVWIQGGYRYTLEETRGSQLGYDSHGAFAEALIELPARFQLFLRSSYGAPAYHDFVPNPQRDDDVFEASVDLSRPIFRPGLEWMLTYRYLMNDSNQAFAEYDRHIFMLSLRQHF